MGSVSLRACSTCPCAAPFSLRSGSPRLLKLIHMSATCQTHPAVGLAMLNQKTSASGGLGWGFQRSHYREVRTAASRGPASNDSLPLDGSDNSFMSPEEAQYWKGLMETIEE